MLKQFQSQDKSSYLLTTSIILVLSLALYFFWKRLSRKQENTQQIKWAISTEPVFVGISKIKRGFGLNKLKEEKLEQLTYIWIEQKNLNILKRVVDWNFGKLNRLFLHSNNIQSLQLLCWFYMPELQVLAISNNNITQIKSLRKLKTSSLVWIQLNNNPICDTMNTLVFLELDNLQYLWGQFFENDKQFHDDISWLAKCSSKYLQKLHLKGSSRINNHKVFDTLRIKYQRIDIRLFNI